MIQRIQSVYMAVSAVLMSVFLFSPVFAINTIDLFMAKDCKLGLSFAALFALISAINVFLYRKRPMQIRLGWAALVCNVLVFFFYGVHYYFLSKGHAGDLVSAKVAAIIPFITFVFTLLAIGAIRKDHNLVRAADRLR